MSRVTCKVRHDRLLATAEVSRKSRSYAHEMERMTGSGDLKRRAMVQNYLIRQPSILEEEEMGSVVPLKQVTTLSLLISLTTCSHG